MKDCKIIVLLLLVFTTFSCEDYLEPNPESLVTPENMDDPELLLRGAYEHLRGSNESWKITTMMYLIAGSDEATQNAKRTQSGEEWGIATFGYNTTNTMIRDVWTFLYGGINASNHAIALSKKLNKPKIEAEARFMRGFYYFTLATLHGGVPIIKTPDDDPFTQRASLEEVLLFIEEDWKFAFENGPENPVMAGRTTKYTAAGFLAKLYLYIGGSQQNNVDAAIEGVASVPEVKKLVSFKDWSDTRTPETYFQLAEQFASEVYYGRYSLIDNYRDNFRKSGEDMARSNEWLFNIEASDLHLNGNPEAFNASKWEREFVPTYEFLDLYVKKDTRIGNIGSKAKKKDPTIEIGNHIFFEDTSFDSKGNNRINKWRKDQALDLHGRWLTMSVPLLRYSDVILMLAEAKFLNGDETGARDLLNEVRERASSVGSEIDQVVLEEMNTAYFKSDFMEELMDERKRELAFEGYSRIDLIRTGKFFSAINSLTDETSAGEEWEMGGPSIRAMKENLAAHPYRMWLPIPAEQVSVARYIQNPGYPIE
jgi:hypothetical protein